SPLWASIYRFPRYADGSGLGYCARKGSARTVLHTAAKLLSLDPCFRGVEALSALRPPAFVFWETVALLAPSSSAPAPGRRLILKSSKLFRLLISHLKRLVNVGGVGSMVDGSHVTAQIVFDVCLDLSAWDTDEIAMRLMLSDERSHAT
ncbi:hypothetical protein HID58_056402, partial [Brassica napus]